jgi:hypothetical protein
MRTKDGDKPADGGKLATRVESWTRVADRELPAKGDKASRLVVVRIDRAPAIAANQGKSAFFWHSTR